MDDATSLTARDWTEDGAFRHSVLYLFDEEDAHRLQQAGAILAQAAIAGDPRAAAGVERADYWQRQLEDVVAGMEADLRDLPAPKPKPAPPGEFVTELRRLLGEALKIRHDPGCRPVAHLVDGLRSCLTDPGEEPEPGEAAS